MYLAVLKKTTLLGVSLSQNMLLYNIIVWTSSPTIPSVSSNDLYPIETCIGIVSLREKKGNTIKCIKVDSKDLRYLKANVR